MARRSISQFLTTIFMAFALSASVARGQGSAPYVDNRANTPVVIIPEYQRPTAPPAYSQPDSSAPADAYRNDAGQGYYMRPPAVTSGSSLPPHRPAFQAPREPAPAPFEPRLAQAPTTNSRYDGGSRGSDPYASTPKSVYRPYEMSGDTTQHPSAPRVYQPYRLAARSDEAPRPQSVYRDASPRLAKRMSESDSLPAPPEVIPPGKSVEVAPHGEVYEEGPPYDGVGPEMEYPGDDGCYPYDECNDEDYDPMAILRLLARWSRNLTVDAGVEGFKGPTDFGLVGNFGFHEGLNWGVPLFPWWGIGGQIGFEVVNTDFQDNVLVNSVRQQYFFTAGLFHRPGECGGLQYGVVYDHLRDNYLNDLDLRQVRAEVSYCGAYQHEIGFLSATSLTKDQELLIRRRVFTVEPLDQYAFFYRHRFCGGGNCRLWGGFTGESDGILGADYRIPLSNHWAVESDFNYIIPHEQSPLGSRESWNLSMSLVFYPGGRAQCGDRSLYHPLFEVANNGSLISDFK